MIFKRKPLKHQKKMIEFGLNKKQFAFFCEMGTGKTQPIINIFSLLKKREECNNK